MTFSITSRAFGHGQRIPTKYTCEGEDIAPTLEWGGEPDGTASFALIVDDPDAPDPAAPKMTYVHWVLYDIPPEAHALAEGMTAADLPRGARAGLNDWERSGYGGPCPPIGRHRYFFKLYALDTVLGDLGANATKDDVLRAMQGRVLAEAQLMGTFEKGD